MEYLSENWLFADNWQAKNNDEQWLCDGKENLANLVKF